MSSENIQKINTRRSYDFPTKRLLLMRSSKDRLSGGNGFGIKIIGGRQRSDGKLGCFIDQVISGETLNYLHGEISEGDEILEWNGIPMEDKESDEVQSLVNIPTDEVELLVRSNTRLVESPSIQMYSQEVPTRTCLHRNSCVSDTYRYPKMCPSHNTMPHMHDGLHPCFHQHAHTCQRPILPHCELHPCIHKMPNPMQHSMLAHVCRNDWSVNNTSTENSHVTNRNVKQLSNIRITDETHQQPQQYFNKAPFPEPSSFENRQEFLMPNVSEQDPITHSEIQSIQPLNVSGKLKTTRPQTTDVMSTHVDKEIYRNSEPIDSESHTSVPMIDEPIIDTEVAENEEVYGKIELILTFDDYDQSLTVHVARARGLRPMDLNGLADPFVKLRLHPDPTEDFDLNRQVKYIPNSLKPDWQQTVVFMNCLKRTLRKRVLEVTVWDFDRLKMNDFMGQAIIHLGVKEYLNGQPHWFKLHALRDIVIPGYRQPGTRLVAPPVTQSDSLKPIKLVKDIRNQQSKLSSKGRTN